MRDPARLNCNVVGQWLRIAGYNKIEAAHFLAAWDRKKSFQMEISPFRQANLVLGRLQLCRCTPEKLAPCQKPPWTQASKLLVADSTASLLSIKAAGTSPVLN